MNCTDPGQLCPPGGEKRARRMAKYREHTTKSLLAFWSSGRTVQLGHHPAKSYPNYQLAVGVGVSSQGTVLFQTVSFSPCWRLVIGPPNIHNTHLLTRS
ncbi:unnamed protein product [Sphagnum jensenii]